MANNITPRAKDYSAWYRDVIATAELAESSDVRGCMVIRPGGYAIWENIQAAFDRRFKETGHENAYFPLFIPKSYLAREAAHVEGFAMECAVVTHYGLKAKRDGDEVEVVIDPDKELEEALVVRPTSETIINAHFARWIQSHRDLPLLINQWANICRWEMRTRLFLRTTEFLWQEGHTAHATPEEAREEVLRMLEVYREVIEGTLAIPVIPGVKTAAERFAGAVETYAVEAMMQDHKSLQAGTSHDLGTNFAQAFGTQFQNEAGELTFVSQTSWGVSTRLIGALIMTHSDDEGLIVPPKVARTKVAIVPIYKNDEQRAEVLQFAAKVKSALPTEWCVKLDDRQGVKPGAKFFHWEQRGVPIRLEVGPRDVKNGAVVAVTRHDRQKTALPVGDGLAGALSERLDAMQQALFDRALAYREAATRRIDDYAAFKRFFAEEGGGFALCHWDGTPETEAKIKAETKATIRCIPFGAKEEAGADLISGQPSKRRVIFAIAY